MGDEIRDNLEEAMQRGYVVAYRLLGTRDAARDACQEAAARALRAGGSYDRARPFYPWFYRILKNHCFDRLAQQKRSVSVGEPPEQVSNAVAERQLVHDERARAVSRAIETLSAEHREIVELRHFNDLSYDAIAEVLECPVGTVMSRLYRARKRLAQALASDPDFAGDPS